MPWFGVRFCVAGNEGTKPHMNGDTAVMGVVTDHTPPIPCLRNLMRGLTDTNALKVKENTTSLK